MNIVIKVGTQSILSHDGAPFESVMQHLVEQIARLKQAGHQVILVSSGAVSSGRKVASQTLACQFGNSIGEKQLLASLGQHELMHIYASLFKKFNILVSQLLLTKQDFQTRKHYLNIASLLREILQQKNIIPIINENDSVAIEELMFTDNDELAGLISAQMNAEKLIILTNVQGVYTKNPSEPEAKIIPVIDPEKDWFEVSASKSAQGRGGMSSKLNTARKMSRLGITTHIASIDVPSVITRIIAEESLGTLILPSTKKSNIKKWMAYNNTQQAASIFINQGLFDILRENKHVVSILPVGIVKFDADFKKGDLVEVISPQGQAVAIGIAKYDANKLNEYLGEKNKPAFIHYDHLHIF